MALITINGVEMPEPNTYSIPMSDMEASDSAYSESGVKIRNRIRQGIVRLELGWLVNGDDAKALLSAIKPNKVAVKYLDPRTDTKNTADMFVEDRSCNLVLLGKEDDSESNLWRIGFNLVQY